MAAFRSGCEQLSIRDRLTGGCRGDKKMQSLPPAACDVTDIHRGAFITVDISKISLLYAEVNKQESRAVARKPRDAAAVLFGLKFADNIHYKFKSQASKARLHSSKHNGTKQNLRQNGDSRSFKVTCFGVSGKAIRQ